jgi:hypothetical protein
LVPTPVSRLKSTTCHTITRLTCAPFSHHKSCRNTEGIPDETEGAFRENAHKWNQGTGCTANGGCGTSDAAFTLKPTNGAADFDGDGHADADTDGDGIPDDVELGLDALDEMLAIIESGGGSYRKSNDVHDDRRGDVHDDRRDEL